MDFMKWKIGVWRLLEIKHLLEWKQDMMEENNVINLLSNDWVIDLGQFMIYDFMFFIEKFFFEKLQN